MTGHRHLPLADLVDFVDPDCRTVDAIARACHVSTRSVHRWKATDSIPLFMADNVAVAMGVHPSAIWGTDYWEINKGLAVTA